jgi:hypothetical protein
MSYLQAHKRHVILGVILALALGLRLWGIGSGLPFVGFQPDEFFVSGEGLILLRDGFTLSRLAVGALHGYIQAGVGWTVFSLTQPPPTPLLTIQETYLAEGIETDNVGVPTSVPAYYLWGRIAVAVMGVATIWLTYLIGREIDSAEVGLLGALFLAASPLHAEHSHNLVRDMPGLLFLLSAFYFLLLAYRQERWGRSVALGILTGISAGLGILAKSNNVILVAPLALTLGLSLWRAAGRRSLREILRVGGVAVLAVAAVALALALVFSYANPIIASWNYDVFKLNYDLVFGHIFGYSSGFTPFWVIDYFLRDPWRFVFLFSLPGMGLAAVALRERGWLLLSIPVPYLLALSFFTTHFLHWLIVALPFLGILAGLFLVHGGRWLDQRLTHWRLPWSRLVALGALGITLTSFKLIATQDYWFSQKDVRVTASEWLQANIPDGAKVAIERYGPYLPSKTRQVLYVVSAAQKDVETYRTEGVGYLVINASEYQLVQAEATHPQGDPAAKEYLARYQTIADLPLVQEFVGPAALYPGTWVRVYRID